MDAATSNRSGLRPLLFLQRTDLQDFFQGCQGDGRVLPGCERAVVVQEEHTAGRAACTHTSIQRTSRL